MEIKAWFNKIKMFLFGIPEFNRKEIGTLITNLKNGRSDEYYYKIVNRVVEQGGSKYTVMDGRLYYETLAPKLASQHDKGLRFMNPTTYFEYLSKIKYDIIFVEELLKAFEESYSGIKLTKKD